MTYILRDEHLTVITAQCSFLVISVLSAEIWCEYGPEACGSAGVNIEKCPLSCVDEYEVSNNSEDVIT